MPVERISLSIETIRLDDENREVIIARSGFSSLPNAQKTASNWQRGQNVATGKMVVFISNTGFDRQVGGNRRTGLPDLS